MLQLACRDVNGDADIPTERLTQPRCVQTGLVKDPAADRDDQAGFLSQRDEVERRNLAEGRVLPAKQRFEPDHLERLELHDRLVSERELFLVERFAQLRDSLEAVERSLVEIVVVEGVVGIAVALRARYIAASACFSSSALLSPSEIPMLAEIRRCRSPTSMGVPTWSSRRSATTAASAGSLTDVRRTANSSPPSRATESPARMTFFNRSPRVART